MYLKSLWTKIVENRCVDCGRYTDKGCYRGMYYSPGKERHVFNFKNIEEERKPNFLMSLLTGKCGKAGRFFKWRI